MMDDLHNMKIDVLKGFLRIIEDKKYPNKSYSVANIIMFYYNFQQHSQHERVIAESIVTEWQLGDGMANGIIDINKEKTRLFLEPFNTNEYIIDRCFDRLIKLGNGLLHDLLDEQSAGVNEANANLINAKIIKSGLVEITHTNYSRSKVNNEKIPGSLFKLNADGIVVLSEWEKYSDYKKSLEENKPKAITPIQNILHVHGDVVGSNVLQDSPLRDFSPTQYPNQNITNPDKPQNQQVGSLTKFWKLISENKLISSLIFAAIVAMATYLLKYFHLFQN